MLSSKMRLTSVFLCWSTWATILVHARHSQPHVKINGTTVEGLKTNVISDNGNFVSEFLGIPYAPQPIRFSPAIPYILTKPTLDATAYGAVCNQQFLRPGSDLLFNIGNPSESEDCLSLNVWTPVAKSHPSKALPVLFWIFGGSLQFGGTNQKIYNGSSLASHDVVVVTINYRTNAFGFPGATQLPLEDSNLGLLDQRLALQWVRTNIAAFGGDKERITIFGQSAGSFSVDSLLLQGPAENPPFQSAILESGVSFTVPINKRGALFNQLAAGVGCTQDNGTVAQLNCVRAVPATKIKSVETKLALGFSAVADEVTVFSNPFQRRTLGLSARVPIIIGTNSDEASLFTLGQKSLTTFISDMYSPLFLKALLELYPVPGKYPTDSAAISQIFTDFSFHCPAAYVALLASKHVAPVYRYLYTPTIPNVEFVPGTGAYHTAEVPLVFGTYPSLRVTGQEVALSTYLQGVWTGFAKNPRRGPWPAINSLEQDLAYIGVNGSSGVTMQSRKTYDEVCPKLLSEVVFPALFPGMTITNP